MSELRKDVEKSTLTVEQALDAAVKNTVADRKKKASPKYKAQKAKEAANHAEMLRRNPSYAKKRAKKSKE